MENCDIVVRDYERARHRFAAAPLRQARATTLVLDHQ
jgi:hypothetical protein